jgi:hypothetical protein
MRFGQNTKLVVHTVSLRIEKVKRQVFTALTRKGFVAKGDPSAPQFNLTPRTVDNTAGAVIHWELLENQPQCLDH